jgi:hypothetical protein
MEDDMEVDAGEAMEEDPPPQPFKRRGSMSEEEERTRRASIKAILGDTSRPEAERRRSIQHLMDGRRTSLGGAVTPPTHANDPNRNGGHFHDPDDSPDMNDTSQSGIPSADLLQDSFSCLTDHGAISNEQTKRAELTRPQCSHYDRNCTMIAPCCGAAFGCRICHDDCPILPPKVTVQQVRRRHQRSSSLPGSFTNMNQQPEDTHHTIDRFAVREVICRQCYTRQNAKT